MSGIWVISDPTDTTKWTALHPLEAQRIEDSITKDDRHLMLDEVGDSPPH